MSDTKISLLPAAAALGGSEAIPGVQAAANVHLSPQQIADYAAGAYPIHPGYRSGGIWYDLWYDLDLGAGLSSFTGEILFTPITLKRRATFTDLAIYISTVSSGTVLAGLYAHDAARGLPTGLPLCTVAPLSAAALGYVTNPMAAAVTLQPGLYWSASGASDATLRVASHTQSSSGQATGLIGDSTLANLLYSASAAQLQYALAGTFASLPDVTSASIVRNNHTGRGARLFGKVQ